MQKFMNVFLGIVTVVSLVVAGSRVAVADTFSGTVTLVNPGFELPGTGKISGGWDMTGNDIPGWSNGGTGTYSAVGCSGVQPGGANGSNYQGFLCNVDSDGGSCIQLTNHKIAAGETYTLSFYSNATQSANSFLAALYYVGDDGTRVTLGSATQNVGTNSLVWTQYKLTASATAASVGKYVGVYFSDVTPQNVGYDWASIDDVALTYTAPALAVPKLSTMILFGVGLIGLPAYAWRKRK